MKYWKLKYWKCGSGVVPAKKTFGYSRHNSASMAKILHDDKNAGKSQEITSLYRWIKVTEKPVPYVTLKFQA